MTIVAVPIAKASVSAKDGNPGKIATLEVDTSRFSDEMYSLVMFEGLKAVLNSRMSAKLVGAVTKKTGKDLELAQEAAMKIATENLEKLYAGEAKTKTTKVKATAEERAVITEARRNAREVVKNILREKKVPISQVPASKITEAADAMIAGDPSYLEKARATLAARANITSEIDITAIAAVDPKLKAKADKAKAEKAAEKGLSAKQAGIPTRRKPKAEPAQHAVH